MSEKVSGFDPARDAAYNALLAEVETLRAQNARLRRMRMKGEEYEYEDRIGDLLDNQAWIILSHVGSFVGHRDGDPGLMERWQDAWADGEVQKGYFTPTRGVAAWIAKYVTLAPQGEP